MSRESRKALGLSHCLATTHFIHDFIRDRYAKVSLRAATTFSL